MYDRLHRLGLCMSYSRSLEVMEVVGGYNASALVDALKNGRYIRFIGDNLNFTVDVHNERLATHKHMVHMFATAALVSETSFEDVPNVPEIPLQDLNVGHISLSREEYSVIRSDCVHLICNIVADFLPQLSFMSVTDNNRHNVNRPMKTTVIPLEVLPLNEQYYGDDVEILLYYEKLIRQIHNEACIPLTAEHQYQIGGDQLTWARFLRLRNAFPEERIDHLSPVTHDEFLNEIDIPATLRTFSHRSWYAEACKTAVAQKRRPRRFEEIRHKQGFLPCPRCGSGDGFLWNAKSSLTADITHTPRVW